MARKFLIIAWKDEQPFAKSGKEWVALTDPALPYERMREEFAAISKDGTHEKFDCAEVIPITGAIKSRKFVTKAEASRRSDVLAQANAEADERKAKQAKTESENALAAAEADAARHKAALADHEQSLKRARAWKLAEPEKKSQKTNA